MVRIGKLLLGKGPAIALTLTNSEALPLIRKAKRLGAQLLEIRIDRFRRLDEEWILRRIRSLRPLRMPLIATIRSQREGGGQQISEARRLELFKKIIPKVEAIDLELSSHRLVRSLVPLAHRLRKRVILSYHNFKATPSENKITALIRKGKRAGADVVKISVTPKRKEEVARLLLLTHQHRDKNLISIAMGRYGTPSRVLASLFGSLLTYSFVNRRQAPGQLSIKKLFEELKPFGRNFD